MTTNNQDDFDASVSEAVTVGIRHIGIAVYSSGKILKYLMTKGYSHSVASEAVNRIVERGYIDDYRAARKIISTRVNRKQESRRMLYQRLISDGINPLIADEIVHDLEDDRTTCKSLIESLLPASSESFDDEQFNILIRKAYQRGYSPEIASRVIREVTN